MSDMRCPQCGSKWCGPIVCRFSALAHKTYIKQWNAGADQVKQERTSLRAYEIEYSPSGDPMNIVPKRDRK